jgi:hypothetical protein
LASGSADEVRASLTAAQEGLEQALMHLRHLERIGSVEVVVWARAHAGIVSQLSRATSVRRGLI